MMTPAAYENASSGLTRQIRENRDKLKRYCMDDLVLDYKFDVSESHCGAFCSLKIAYSAISFIVNFCSAPLRVLLVNWMPLRPL